ncbi:uncharacterized protein [Diadema antillarum]|uniref:uncharacterized protein isoform X1 n=1 Tax=Diadema antillarum TaxID=105358 RepID=UPI003A83FFC6
MGARTMEEVCDDYFSSINPMAYKIIEEKRKCMEKNKRNWERLTQDEKDSLLDEWFIDPDLKIRYEIRLHGKLPDNDNKIPDTFPRLKVQGGTRTVQFTEHEDGGQGKETTITWRDEFSGPFSWETKCQQDLPMMSPASITAATTRHTDNDVEYPENRFSMGLDSTEESRLIVNGGKHKSKDSRRATDNSEKQDKTRLSRKDSKKEEKARERERAREKENQRELEKRKEPEAAAPVVSQQPKAAQSPMADMSLAMTDRNGRAPPKKEKAKSPKPQRSRTSGRTSPKRDGRQKDREIDMEDLLPTSSLGEDVAPGGINFSMADFGSSEVDGMLSSFQSSTPPPPSSESLGESQGSTSAPGGDADSFDFLLQW